MIEFQIFSECELCRLIDTNLREIYSIEHMEQFVVVPYVRDKYVYLKYDAGRTVYRRSL